MAFNGLAFYDSTFFDGAKESVHELVELLSPHETPLLDMLGTSAQPAINVYHQWLEDELQPRTLVVSETVVNTTDDTALAVHFGGDNVGNRIPVGTQLLHRTSGEYLLVTATSAATLTVTRGDGGTTLATIAEGEELEVISQAALEGADVGTDLGVGRTLVGNYVQLFSRDLVVSDTMRAVAHYGVDDEFAHQREKKMKEILLDLERAVTAGLTSGNTIGGDAARRRMSGIRALLTTNPVSIGTITVDTVQDVIKTAWDNGGSNLDLVLCGHDAYRVINTFTTERIRQPYPNGAAGGTVQEFYSAYGTHRVMPSRWIRGEEFMVLDTSRIDVVPLRGNSFYFNPVARTGLAEKGQLAGEYTLELRGEKTMAKGRVGGF